MRTAFLEVLLDLAGRDERIWLVTADLGFSVFEPFESRFPARYLNVGVAEQNMIGIAAGLALSGKIVFAYSIANFPSLRCLEQIRNDICGHNLNVKIVAVGGGLAYGSLGHSHHSLEDLAIIRSLPRMEVVAPGDSVETRVVTHLLAGTDGPAYLRLGKGREAMVHATPPALRRGVPFLVRSGEKVAVLSTGGMLHPCLKAAERARENGINAAVYSVPWLKPMDRDAIAGLARRYTGMVTVEDAQVSGGLGGAVAEILAELPAPRARLTRLGAPDVILAKAYGQESALTHLGLGVDAIAEAVVALR